MAFTNPFKKSKKKNLEKDAGIAANKKAEEVKSTLVNYRQPFEPGWDRFDRAYYGDIWDIGQGYRPYENTIFEIVETAVSIMTDSQSHALVAAMDPQFEKQAKNLTKAIEWVYEDQKFQLLQPELIRQSLVSAPGFLHVYYDPNANGGDGKDILEVLEWKQVWLAGDGNFIEDTSKSVFELRRTKGWLQRAYPLAADEIEKLKADTMPKDQDFRQTPQTRDPGAKFRRQKPHEYIDEDILILQVTYVKDYSLKPIPEEVTAEELEEEKNGELNVKKFQDHPVHMESHAQDRAELLAQLQLSPETSFQEAEVLIAELIEANPEAEKQLSAILFEVKLLENHIEEHSLLARENPKGQMPKYPNDWRVIEKVQKINLYDGPSKYEHNDIPLVPWYCTKDHTIYGMPDVAQIYSSQQMQATLLYNSYKGVILTCQPQVIIDAESGITPEDIHNEPGGAYMVAAGTGMRYLQNDNMSSDQYVFSKDRVQSMKDISGIDKPTQGKMPSPNASGVTVKRLQTQAVGRVRLKERTNDHYSLDRTTNLLSSNIMQFWDDEKVLYLETKGQEPEQIIYNPLEMIDMKYKTKTIPGSAAGIDSDAFNAMLLNFVQGQNISFDQFLQVANFPKADKLRELVNEQAQIAEQMQQLQAELEEAKIESIKARGSVDPTLLSKEERQVFEEIQREERNEKLTGVDEDQPQ